MICEIRRWNLYFDDLTILILVGAILLLNQLKALGTTCKIDASCYTLFCDR